MAFNAVDAISRCEEIQTVGSLSVARTKEHIVRSHLIYHLQKLDCVV